MKVDGRWKMEDGREKQRGTRVSAFEIRSEIRLEDPADGETRGGAVRHGAAPMAIFSSQV